MKIVGLLAPKVILGSVCLIVCAMSFSLAQPAFAESSEPTGEPTANQLKNSKDRGIFLKVPGSPAAFEVQRATATPKATTETKKKVVKTVARGEAVKSQTRVVSTTTPAKTAPAKVKTVQAAPVKVAKEKPQAKIKYQAKEKVQTETASAPVAEDSMVKAWLNKSGRRPSYKNGEKMQVSVKARKDCNLVIYDFDGKGTLTQIFPNDYQKENSIKAGETITIGGDNSSFDFQCGLADGESKQQERLFVFAYPAKEDAPLSVAMSKIPDSPFRSANMSLEQYRKLVNESKVYYARSVKVMPKRAKAVSSGISQIETVSDELNTGDNAPNKTELSFSVEK